MRRFFYIAMLLGMICTGPSLASVAGQSENFVPPRVIFAGGIAYPDKSAGGMVELAVNLDSSGYVRSVHTVRDIPALTAPTADAVPGWKFSPGFLNGTAVDSNISVYVVFNPGIAPTQPLQLQAVEWTWQSEHPAFLPPEISAASYADYPEHGIGGTVVVDLSVNKAGIVSRSAAVYTTPALTNSAIAAANSWKFTPGQYRGTTIPTHAVAAFVFRAPLIKRSS